MKTESHNKIFYILIFLFIAFAGCSGEQKSADHIFYNGVVYTVDSTFSVASAFAVKDGKIVAVGTDEEILEYRAKDKTNLNGKFVYPGFHDGHCHFYGYGTDMKKIWLTGTNSFAEVLDLLEQNKDQLLRGWIFGRGWDQNDWNVKNYPDKTQLDSLFPDTPVFLLRIDGHAALVNQKALDLARINENTVVSGGFINKQNGKLTGILIDAAVDIVYGIVPKLERADQREALINAQKSCFEAGITSVTDAGIENTGLKWSVLQLIDSLQKTGELKMRVNAMAAPEEFEFYKKEGRFKTDNLTVHGFKVYSDGSLGSRGACLLESYKDQEGHSGFLIHNPKQLDSIASLIASINFQMNTHCIGDSSQRLMLQIYEKHVGAKKDHRWRIEHAQVIHPSDLEYYKRNKIIPSVQPTHATSDMYWAEDRIGPVRIKGAYAYKDLLNQNGMIVSGSDFPVEYINPLYGIYAAVARKDHKGFPEGGFEPENKLSREEALKAFTIWPSYAAFTENEKGSIRKGMFADFIVLDADIMTINESEIWSTPVNATYIGGKKVFQRGE